MIQIPQSFSETTTLDQYIATAVETSRENADYNLFWGSVNHGVPPTLAIAQPYVFHGIDGKNYLFPTELDRVVQAYYRPAVSVVATQANPYVHTTGLDVTVSRTETLKVEAQLGASGKGFSASISASYGVTNVLSSTTSVMNSCTYPNSQGVERFYVPWLLCYRMALCTPGTSNPYPFIGDIEDAAPWYKRKGTWPNRAFVFNEAATFIDAPTENITWQVYDINGNIVPNAT